MRIPYAGTEYRLQILAGGVALHGLGLALPVFMMQLYDRIIPNESFATLAWLALATVVAMAAESFLRIARHNWASWHAERAAFNCRRQIIGHILATPVVSQRLREVFGALQYLLYDSYLQLSFFFADIPFGLLYLGLSFLIHPAIAVFLLGLGICQLVCMHLIRQPYRRVAELRRQLAQDRDEMVNGLLQSLAELKALGAEESALRHHGALFSRIEANEREAARLELARTAINRGSAALSVFGPIIVGGLFVISGDLSLGALTAAVLLARRSLSPLQGLAERWYQAVDREAASKIVDLVSPSGVLDHQAPDTRRDLPVQGLARLDLHDLVIRQGIDEQQSAALALSADTQQVAGDDRVILSVASLSLAPGSLVALAEPLQAPVLEFFQVLRGTNPFFSGEILLGSYHLSRFSRAAIGRKVVLLQSRDQLLPGTMLENIASFDPSLFAPARDAAALLGLEPFFDRLERGHETPVSDAVLAAISPSIIQRIALARALALRPSVLLLHRFDEALDSESTRICLAAIRMVLPHLIIFYHGRNPDYLSLATVDARLDGLRLDFAKEAP